MKSVSDETLAARAQAGDALARHELLRRYEHEAKGFATRFFIRGADDDDLRQEARIGLLKAIDGYSTDRGVPFRGFARMSIYRQLVTALRGSQREKHRPLDESVRQAEVDGELLDVLDTVAGGVEPDLVLEHREEIARLVRGMATLSALERRWLVFAINGGAYSSRVHGRDKSAEGAVDRARLKLRRAA